MFLEYLRHVAKAFHSSIQSSGNVTITNHGSSTNNKTYINVQINNANKSSNESATIEELEDHMDILAATTEYGINCLPLTSEPLYLKFRPRLQIIPFLTSNYHTVIIKGYKTESLGPEMRKLFKQLSHTLIDLKFFDCEFDVMTLSDILCEFPLLETLELSMKLTMDATTELTGAKLPKLLHLSNFKMEINVDMIENILYMTSNATNMEFLTFFNAVFDINEFNDFLEQQKSLKSLHLTKSIVNNTNQVFSNIEALHLNNINKLSSMNYINFDCLKQLHTLELTEVNDELLNILKSKCIDGLQELTINYTAEQNENANKLINHWRKEEGEFLYPYGRMNLRYSKINFGIDLMKDKKKKNTVYN